ncbi:hypothetical protein MATL_G00094810 [Megalops atlanticus]|uniref:Uncharacterized protein n=1 Tax=Megalops atlanticus TaxID=7932 RepID=A0A9D3Q644_MEGAT|nr:hypothetical protein MATL_G00094810 [Megalops atlanticus]
MRPRCLPLSKCDKYVLTHQEVASDRGIQTRLTKLSEEIVRQYSCRRAHRGRCSRQRCQTEEGRPCQSLPEAQ